MVQSSTERSREFRKRQQQKLAESSAKPASYIVGDFAAFLDGNHPVFVSDDPDPEIKGPRDEYITPRSVAVHANERLHDIGLTLDWRDIKKAAAAVTALSEAATCIAEVLNLFKWLEVNAAIKRLQETDLSDPDARDAAFREVRRLGDISKGLNKMTRLNIPVISVPGETEDED